MYNDYLAAKIESTLIKANVKYESSYDESTGEYTFKFKKKHQEKKNYSLNELYDDLLREQQGQV